MKRFVMLSVLVMVQISAMDVERSEPVNMSLLAALPVEVLNYLAKFLTFGETESEQEFVARTKAMVSKLLPEDCEKCLSPSHISEMFDGTEERFSLFTKAFSNKTLVAYSPSEMNIALLEFLDSNPEYTLKLIHHSKEQKVKKLAVPKKDYSHLAVSSHADMFATIEKIKKIDNTPRRSEVMCYIITTKLTIQNIATKTTQEFVIPGGFCCVSADKHPTIAFNKQGTAVIVVHGNDWIKSGNYTNDTEKNLVPDHIIIPVTINTRKVPETLQDYFEQKGVCKKLILH